MLSQRGVWSWTTWVSESSPTTGSERGLARFSKTSSEVNGGQSAASQFCPSIPNPGDSVAFTGISKDLANFSISPENIQAEKRANPHREGKVLSGTVRI